MPTHPSFVEPGPRREGAGSTGCWPHPRALRAKKSALCARKQRQGSRNNRHSLRNGLRLIRDLLGAPGFRATVAARMSARLDPSIGGSGPHDFAVRIARASSCALMRPSQSRTNVRDEASAPLRERGTAYINHDFQKYGRGIFLPGGLDISRTIFR